MIRIGLPLALLAGAAGAAADVVPHVDVDDLPALPAQDAVGQDTDLAVLAATSTEEDVVVGAAKREQSLGTVASAVTVVTGDRLRRMGYRTVAEALRGVVGVFISDDRMIERVGVRGLQVQGDFNTRVLVLIDGAAVNEPWGQFAGVGWDAMVSIDDVARIEVIRGPVSSVYGTNAFFGIISIVTRGATETPRAWGRIGGGQFESGTIAAGFATGGVDRQLRGSVAATSRGGEVLDVPALGPGLDADGVRAINAALIGVYHGGFAQVRFYRRVRELPFSPYESEIDNPDNQGADTQLMAEGGYTRELSPRITTTVRAHVDRYRFRDFLVYGDGLFTDIGDATWIGAELRGRFRLDAGDRFGFTTGGEATFSSTRSQAFLVASPDDAVVVETPFDVEGVYAELDAAPTSWLAATAGVRFDRHSLLEDRVSPRAALFVSKKDRFGAKLLYSEGFRNPSAFEAFFEDGGDFAVNPELRAEAIRSFEAVVWGRPISGLTARLSGFSWNAEQLVEQEPFTDPTSGMELLRSENVGGLASIGAELEASVDPSAFFGVHDHERSGAFVVVSVQNASDLYILQRGSGPHAPVGSERRSCREQRTEDPMKNVARVVLLSMGFGVMAMAGAPGRADACGGYVISEAVRVEWALTAFLGEMGQRVSMGPPLIRDGRARVAIEFDADAGAGRRAKARMTYVLVQRDGAWKVVDWSLPVRVPATRETLAARR